MDIGPVLHFGGMDMGGGAVGFGVIEGSGIEVGFAGKSVCAIGHRRAAGGAEQPLDPGGGAIDGGGALGPAPCAIA